MALHPQAQALLDDLGEPGDGPFDVEGTRAAARAAAPASRDRIGLGLVQDLDADGVPVRL